MIAFWSQDPFLANIARAITAPVKAFPGITRRRPLAADGFGLDGKVLFHDKEKSRITFLVCAQRAPNSPCCTRVTSIARRGDHHPIAQPERLYVAW